MVRMIGFGDGDGVGMNKDSGFITYRWAIMDGAAC